MILKIISEIFFESLSLLRASNFPHCPKDKTSKQETYSHNYITGILIEFRKNKIKVIKTANQNEKCP